MTARQREAAVWLGWLALCASPLLFTEHAALINEIAIFALFALSLDLVLGYAGIVSLGHAAFFGAGAYAAGLFAKHVAGEPLLGLVAAAVAGACLGALTSWMIARGSALTRLMITLGVALLLQELANKFDDLTGGVDGMQGVVIGPLLGVFEFDLFARTAAIYSLLTLGILFILMRRVVRSPFGVSLSALRDNPLRATALGMSVNARLAVVYTLAGALAGAAGGLLTQTTGFVSLDVLDFHRSADVLLALILGGAGHLWGAILGALVFRLAHDLLSGITSQYWMFWVGLFFVVLTTVGRQRLASFRRSWLRSRSPA